MFEYRTLDQSITASTVAEIANDYNSRRATVVERADALAKQASEGIGETARVLMDSSHHSAGFVSSSAR
jgi:hypothetical protein